jgi:uncharacterized repeat protein (TIGR03803 family)
MTRVYRLQWLCGVFLFCVAATASHAQTEAVLSNFAGSPDGSEPLSSLAMNNNNLYGTTYAGGLGYGTVFELTPNGSGGWVETPIYNFCSQADCTDGENPAYSYVIFDGQGNLYGTTYGGGEYGYGVVFELSPGTDGSWTETVLHNFANTPDGANPGNGLIMDSAENLYGMTFAGGTGDGDGCIFELSPSGSTWTEQVIYDINSTHTGLTLGPAGATGNIIYGSTYSTIFQLTPNGSGGWVPAVLYTFNPSNSATEGSEPVGTMALDGAGNLYGATEAGGANNAGAVFKLTPSTSGDWVETLLFSFGGSGKYGPNGATPFSGVILDPSNNIYGTTKAGGTNGAGTIYEVVAPASGKGTYQEHVVFNFDGEDGAEPKSGLILESGYLYGATYGGGANGEGTVFEANAHAAITKITMTSSPNPSTEGEAVTFTATVTSSAGPPPDGENVRFDKIGNGTLVNGVATFTTKQLPVGSIDTAATYSGDINFTPSNSTRLLQVVDK